jgi:UrcA family protein
MSFRFWERDETLVMIVTRHAIDASLRSYLTHTEDASMGTVTKWISSLTVATVMSLTAVASAAAADDAAAKTVKAWDLDLAKRSDMEMLYERVRAAATDVCLAETQRLYRTTRVRAPMSWRKRCEQDAVDAAIRGIANPGLAAMHTQAPRVASRF